MALNSEVWQGHFGEAFVRTLACATGLTTAKKDLDTEGVDIQISYPGRLNTFRYPAIEAQVKSWSSPKGDKAHFRYPLPVKNYADLVGKVGRDFSLRRYFFLVIVPKDKGKYTKSSSYSLQLHHAVYWVSLMDEPALADLSVTSTKTVYVPKTNLLTSAALITLLGGPQAWQEVA